MVAEWWIGDDLRLTLQSDDFQPIQSPAYAAIPEPLASIFKPPPRYG